MTTRSKPVQDAARKAYDDWLAGRHGPALDDLAAATRGGDLASASVLLTLAGQPEAPEGATDAARKAIEDAPAGAVIHRHHAFLLASGYGGKTDIDQALALRLGDAEDGDMQALTELALLALWAGEDTIAEKALIRAANEGQAHAIAALLRLGFQRGHVPGVAHAKAPALARSGHPLGAAFEATTADLEVRELADADTIPDLDETAIAAISRWLPGAPEETRVLSEDPPVARAPHFMPPAICDYLVANAAPHLQPARILDPGTGESREDPYRNSLTASLPDGVFDIVLWAIKARMAALAGCGYEQGEALSVLAYRPGDAYKPHFDYMTADDGPVSADLDRRGQRIATTLIRLNDGFEGGATVFPKLDLNWAGAPGEALTFANVHSDGTGDDRTLHSGEEVTRGLKLLASLWLRERA
ncbi:prolyl hydroxylase family protein [Hyphobacterium marinum]|uniref:2OG-Fe(II) oxygenase n=1 Tax=Hyphobacterium marinum TaxID=3116574 RepID=A0ABU7LUP2_9PROT|nr:2OG-Fe(II) oxygenase [Hyphobacterium sp. Y6023]MEE2565267.1 2OG-Fe(II) oxygenase [Hyphobacterium sp. Y6023]